MIAYTILAQENETCDANATLEKSKCGEVATYVMQNWKEITQFEIKKAKYNISDSIYYD